MPEFKNVLGALGIDQDIFKLINFKKKTVTGEVADRETVPGKIAILEGLAICAPLFGENYIVSGPQTKQVKVRYDSQAKESFQAFINDLLRHELTELKTKSHKKGCQVSFRHLRQNPKELKQILEVFHNEDRFGIVAQPEYLKKLDEIWIDYQQQRTWRDKCWPYKYIIKPISEFLEEGCQYTRNGRLKEIFM